VVKKRKDVYDITQKDMFKKLQTLLTKFPLMPYSSSAAEFYQIALTSQDTIKMSNILANVPDIVDNKLRNHIFKIHGVNTKTKIVIPKSQSRITNQIKNSLEFKKLIKEMILKKEITADNNENIKLIGFTDKWPLLSLDLALTIGHAHLYNTHFDEHGNLHTTLIDWYDFDKLPETGFTNGINNNAYEQQERGDLTNYVLVIPIVLTKTEVDNL